MQLLATLSNLALLEKGSKKVRYEKVRYFQLHNKDNIIHEF